MKGQAISLNLLPLGQLAIVKAVTSRANMRRRMLDLGLITGTQVETVLRSPAGDPMAYQIRGAVIALRSEEAAQILVNLQ